MLDVDYFTSFGHHKTDCKTCIRSL